MENDILPINYLSSAINDDKWLKNERSKMTTSDKTKWREGLMKMKDKQETSELHLLCVAAVNRMVAENITSHVSYISADDPITFGLKEGGKTPIVCIAWADEPEIMEIK